MIGGVVVVQGSTVDRIKVVPVAGVTPVPHPSRGRNRAQAATVDPEGWRVAARCRGSEPSLFFAPEEDGEDAAEAKRICAECPVRDECLQWALDGDEHFGVWGGTTPRERRRLQRLRRKSA